MEDVVERINNLLPIGSIIKLKNSKTKVMITKYVFEDDADYIGVLWPIGDYDKKIGMVFNTDDIENVFFRGYENEELEAFKKDMIASMNDNISPKDVYKDGVQ